jgi:putative lipoic acid-binding regulatory protein
MNDKQSSIQFPCHFPIKIIGKNTAAFVSEITAITRRHFPETPDSAVACQTSQQANYLAITVTIYVHEQPTLDALYLELTKHPDVKMVL